MNRSYTAHSPYSLTPTERIDTYVDDTVDEFEYDGLQEYDEYAELPEYDEASIDRRWMWIAGIAGVILFIAVGTTGVILGGGDSGSVSATATSAAPSTTAAPAATTTPPPIAAPAPVSPSLPAETVTTVSPTAEASAPAAPEAAVAAPPPAPAPNTITYMVTGNRQLIDMVTVVYTDGQGALQTDMNVALPWVKQVVLNPGVSLGSVTATSVTGQLNCSITDAAGNLVAVQNNNTMIANCLK